MVQNTTPTSKPIGRRPSFDRDAVVAAAMVPFWTRGFEATTLSDLEAATGLDRSSIYNSFGGKDGLYRSATAAYVDNAESAFFEPLDKGTAGVDDVVGFLDFLSENLGSGTNPQGCLIVNDMSAGIDNESTDRYLARLEGGLRVALARSARAGEIAAGMIDQRAQLLVASVLGINIAHRNDDSGIRARNLIEGLRAEILSWRT